MSSEPPTSSLASEDASSDQLVVNLQIVSPSVGVNRPLLFPALSAATTIKQLKEKIRLSLPLRPADDHQRLIHRGRALMRDTDSLLDIFGADTLRNNPDQHTIHLVLRDAPDSQSAMPSSTGSTPSPAPAGQPQNAARPPPHPIYGAPLPAHLTRRAPFQTTASPYIQPSGPSSARSISPSPAHTPEQAAAFQYQHQNMTSWLTQIQREAMARALANQNNPRGRAPLGVRVGDIHSNSGGPGSESNSGRASPVHPAPPVYPVPTHTIYREAIGPTGHSYHVLPAPVVPSVPGGLSPADAQNILRGADSSYAANSMGNALHRSISTGSLQNRPLTQLGASSSVFAPGGSRTSSGRATPDHGLRASHVGLVNNASSPALMQSQARQGVEVYILSSPEGPRALVLNNAAAETYYTPRMPMQPSQPQLRTLQGPGLSTLPQTQSLSVEDALQRHEALRQALVQGQQQLQQLREQQQQYQQQLQQFYPQQQQQQDQHNQQQQLQQQQQQQPQQEPGIGFHPNNPAAGGLTALFFQLIPHFGLILRLALFVWLFTSPTASWSRWLTMISLAAFLFALSTGILNGLAEHAWRPLGRHLENVFPAAEFARRPSEDATRQDGRVETTGVQELNNDHPARLAARLVAQHRDREPWIIGHARRLERAFLLFVASIAPGVAERHIAVIEEEGRRREAEAAAEAAAAAATAAAAAAAATTEDNTATLETGDDASPRQQHQEGNGLGEHLNELAMGENLIAL